jgi:FixJ family two-component response regulator
MEARVPVSSHPPAVYLVAQPDARSLSERPGIPHVLAATADADLQRILDDAVRLLRYTADFVRSGREALTRASARSSSVALVDQSLPDIPGLEVARVLTQNVRELPFVLIGKGLSTSTTVDAMRLGAFTVLEKPVSLNDMVATVCRAVVETRAPIAAAAHPARAVRRTPRSICDRWALYVAKAADADGDLKTLGAWASFAGVSCSTLCEICRLVGIQPLDARDLTRVLRAVVRSRQQGCHVEALLDISDRRTLKAIMARAGLDRALIGDSADRVSLEQFLASQRFVPPTNAALAVLRTLLLGRRPLSPLESTTFREL